MDYTGFGKAGQRNGYKIDRPLTAGEKNSQLDPKQQASEAPLDWLAVVKINSTYLELVDRWYPMKGSATWPGGALFITGVAAGIALFSLLIEKADIAGIVFCFFAGTVLFGVAWLGFLLMRFDIFRHTHYPIRLNRRNRMVYVTRPNDSTLVVPWDDLFFCTQKNDLPMAGKSWDVRAHILGDDGETVEQTFTLAYGDLCDRAGLLQLWEFIRRYMETAEGVEQCSENVSMFMPVDDRREGLAFGIVRVFALASTYLFVQLISSPIAALNILGRWIAMYTSKIPRWPAEIEAACSVEPGDPYQKDWRDNGRYDFWELGWPAICFVIGLGVLCLGGYVFYTSLGA